MAQGVEEKKQDSARSSINQKRGPTPGRRDRLNSESASDVVRGTPRDGRAAISEGQPQRRGEARFAHHSRLSFTVSWASHLSGYLLTGLLPSSPSINTFPNCRF